MAEPFPFTDIFFKQGDSLQPFAVTDVSGNILFANDAFTVLLKFASQEPSLFSFLDAVGLRDFFKHYLHNPGSRQQPLAADANSYTLSLCPCGPYHLLKLTAQNHRPQTETLLRRLLHDIRTPLSTALMAVNNLDFILDAPSGLELNADYSPKEFTGSASKALQEIKEQLDMVSILSKRKETSVKQSNVIALLESLSLPAEFINMPREKMTATGCLMTHIQPGAVKTALEILLRLPGYLKLPRQSINLRFRPVAGKNYHLLEMTNRPQAQPDLLQPLAYGALPQNIQIQLALAEHILLKNHILLSGNIHPETLLFNLHIFIAGEDH